MTSTLDSDLFTNLPQVVTLNFSTNNLKDIPIAIQNAKFGPQLQNLILSNNSINLRHVTPFSNFKRLKTLKLDSNDLKRIVEDDFYGLDELICLDLNQNKIKVLPMRTFLHTRNLTDLRMYGNNLIKVEPFVSLPFLKTLDLSQNKLVTLSNNPFGNLPSLRVLNLANNRLNVLKTSHFNTVMFNLSILRLISNSIRKIEMGVFDNMPNLKKLDLSKNNFKRLPNIRTLEQLQVLSATSMKISYIYPSNFEKLQSVRRMYLANNPLMCDCQMKWLREWYDEEMDLALRKHMEQAAAIDRWTCKVKSKRAKQIKYFHEISLKDFDCPSIENYTSYCSNELDGTASLKPVSEGSLNVTIVYENVTEVDQTQFHNETDNEPDSEVQRRDKLRTASHSQLEIDSPRLGTITDNPANSL